MDTGTALSILCIDAVRNPPYVPPVLHLHEDFALSDEDMRDINIVPGYSTFVHLYNGSDASKSATLAELARRFHNFGREIGTSVMATKPFDTADEDRRAVMDRTHITIQGPLPVWAPSSAADKVNREIEEALRGGMSEAEEAGFGTVEMCRRLEVEVRFGPGGEACPTCLGGIDRVS
jgi:hypothetical protein